MKFVDSLIIFVLGLALGAILFIPGPPTPAPEPAHHKKHASSCYLIPGTATSYACQDDNGDYGNSVEVLGTAHPVARAKQMWETNCLSPVALRATANDFYNGRDCWNKMKSNNTRRYVEEVCRNRHLGHALAAFGHGGIDVDTIYCQRQTLQIAWRNEV
jgi:hypothetical protein